MYKIKGAFSTNFQLETRLNSAFKKDVHLYGGVFIES
jgi:hypothetical protein